MESFLRKRSVRVGLLLLLVIASFVAVYLLRDIFAPLILAFIVAYVLDPVADALERRGLSRLQAVVVIFSSAALLGGALLAGGGYFLARGAHSAYLATVGDDFDATSRTPGAVRDAATGDWYIDRNGDGVPTRGYLQSVGEWFQRVAPEVSLGVNRWVERKREEWRSGSKKDLEHQIEELLDRLWARAVPFTGGGAGEEPPVSAAEGAAAKAAAGLGLFQWLSWMLLCPLYLFFFLLEIDPVIAAVDRRLPGRQRPRIERIFRRVDAILAAFFRGRLMICLVKGGLTAVGLLFLGVPFWLPLGIAAGFLSLIPYIGIWFSIVPALLLSWLDDESWVRLAGVGAVFAGLEGLEGFVLTPRFLGREVGLHPLTVIVTLFIFGRFLGFLGVLLSVPLAAIAKILGEEFLLPLVDEFAAEEPDAPPEAPP
ncbi:MAG: AI-2E family transporter [Planctomycetota bacterium]